MYVCMFLLVGGNWYIIMKIYYRAGISLHSSYPPSLHLPLFTSISSTPFLHLHFFTSPFVRSFHLLTTPLLSLSLSLFLFLFLRFVNTAEVPLPLVYEGA